MLLHSICSKRYIFSKPFCMTGYTSCLSSYSNNILGPEFAYFVANLQYFLDYECRDRARRSLDPNLTRHSSRGPCVWWAYDITGFDFQKIKCAWVQYILVLYLPPNVPIEPTISWHGEPPTAVRRSWPVIGSLNSHIVPRCRRKLSLESLDLIRERIESDNPAPAYTGKGACCE